MSSSESSTKLISQRCALSVNLTSVSSSPRSVTISSSSISTRATRFTTLNVCSARHRSPSNRSSSPSPWISPQVRSRPCCRTCPYFSPTGLDSATSPDPFQAPTSTTPPSTQDVTFASQRPVPFLKTSNSTNLTSKSSSPCSTKVSTLFHRRVNSPSASLVHHQGAASTPPPRLLRPSKTRAALRHEGVSILHHDRRRSRSSIDAKSSEPSPRRSAVEPSARSSHHAPRASLARSPRVTARRLLHSVPHTDQSGCIHFVLEPSHPVRRQF